jgi:type II secretory pathway predicted ATPase ExeA
VSGVLEDGAERDPFGLTANPAGYVETAAIERVLTDAVRALDAGRVPVISGPPGLGKTLVLQLLSRAQESHNRPLYIPFCTLSPEDLATLALGLLEETIGPEPEVQLLEVSRRLADGGQPLLMLVDDAAALPGETAAQLAHWAASSGGAIQLALAGLPGAGLGHALNAFGDRGEELLLVDGLRSDEIPRYVRARLDAAGADPEVHAAFDDLVLAELERASEGNPRRLNLAAQAIMRHARSQTSASVEVPAEPEREAEAGAIPSTANDLVNVGAYRYARGRLVSGDTEEADQSTRPLPEVEEATAPSLHRTPEPPAFAAEVAEAIDAMLQPIQAPEPIGAASEPVRVPPSIGAMLEPTHEPEHETGSALDAGAREPLPTAAPTDAFDAFNREAPTDQVITRPRNDDVRPTRPPRSRERVRWILGGVALLLFMIGLYGLGYSPSPVLRLEDPEPVKPSVVAPPPARTPTAPTAQAIAEPEVPVALPVEPTVEPTLPEPTGLATATPPVDVPIELEPIAEPEPPPVAEPLPIAAVVEPPPAAEPETIAARLPTPAADPEPALSAPPGTVPAPEPVAPPPAELIGVAINATPWAVIDVDGKEIGETPLADIKLTTGRHRFTAHMPDGSTRNRVIRIDAANRTVVFE